MQTKYSVVHILSLLSIILIIGLFIGLSPVITACSGATTTEGDPPEDEPPTDNGDEVEDPNPAIALINVDDTVTLKRSDLGIDPVLAAANISNQDIPEGTTYRLTKVEATDAAGTALTILPTDDITNYFEVVDTNGQISVKLPLAGVMEENTYTFMVGDTYTLTLAAVANKKDIADLTITLEVIADLIEFDIITRDTMGVINEDINTSAEDVVMSIPEASLKDAGATTFTYSLESVDGTDVDAANPHPIFGIRVDADDATVTNIIVKEDATFDYEAKPSYKLVVKATDKKDDENTRRIILTVEVVDMPEADFDTTTRSIMASIKENLNPPEDVVMPIPEASLVDPDADATTFTYSLVSVNGINVDDIPDPIIFDIRVDADATKIIVTAGATFDYEVNPSYAFVVKATDDNNSGNTGEITLTVAVTDVNESPTLTLAVETGAATVSIDRSDGRITAREILAAADIIGGDPDTETSFMDNEYSITRVTLTRGTEVPVPEYTSDNYFVADPMKGFISITPAGKNFLNSTDVLAEDVFTITLAFTDKAELDAHAANMADNPITLRASVELTLTILGEFDLPVITFTSGKEVLTLPLNPHREEDQTVLAASDIMLPADIETSVDTYAFNVDKTMGDAESSIDYKNTYFEMLEPSNGEITLKTGYTGINLFHGAVGDQYTITLDAFDDATPPELIASGNIVITLGEQVPQIIIDPGNAAVDIPDNALMDHPVFDGMHIRKVAIDTGYTYSLEVHLTTDVTTPIEDVFSIDQTTHDITLSQAIDVAAGSEYIITVVVNDGTTELDTAKPDTAKITVTVVANQAPTFAAADGSLDTSIDENVVTTTITIPDATDLHKTPITYSLNDNYGGLFSYDNSTHPTLTVNSLDYEAVPSGMYALGITASDGVLEATYTFTVTVNDVNEAPMIAYIGDDIDQPRNLINTVRSEILPANKFPITDPDVGTVAPTDAFHTNNKLEVSGVELLDASLMRWIQANQQVLSIGLILAR